MSQRLEGQLLSFKLGALDEWDKWANEIPYLSFPADWKIRIIPPSVGVIIRFLVKLPGMRDHERVSVYLDCYNRLANQPGPYWEVYPYRGDVGRCGIDDTGKLLEMIKDRDEDQD